MNALTSNAPSDVPAAWEATEEGQVFLGEFNEYLEEYGQRSDVFAEFGNASWTENPATPIKNMQDYVTETDRDLPAELEELAAERDRFTDETRERLRDKPQSVRDEFEQLVQTARWGHKLQEDHNFWIDQRGTHKVRRVLLEFGRRLAAAGATDERDDVFYLMQDELRDAARALPGGDHRKIVAERKAEMEHFRNVGPPPVLGTEPPGPPPGDPMSKAIGRFFGAPPPKSEVVNVINGNPCSPGKATGTAKVVRSLSEAGKVQPGDILVAPGTMPAWTPLFASIAAVVTDMGGVLSHAAVVAREYGIPAVLGTQTATSLIKDGQTVEVDGTNGVVTILS